VLLAALSPLTRPFQLYARRHYFAPARQHATYVSQVSQLTRAEGQAKALSSLLPLLQPEELAVVKWGRNAQIGKVPDRLRCVLLESATGAPPPVLAAAHTGSCRGSGGVYREATALEVLVGYLYVSKSARLDEVMGALGWSTMQAVG